MTRFAGRRLESNDEYVKIHNGPNAISLEQKHQLQQAWAEHEFRHTGIPAILLRCSRITVKLLSVAGSRSKSGRQDGCTTMMMKVNMTIIRRTAWSRKLRSIERI